MHKLYNKRAYQNVLLFFIFAVNVQLGDVGRVADDAIIRNILTELKKSKLGISKENFGKFFFQEKIWLYFT